MLTRAPCALPARRSTCCPAATSRWACTCAWGRAVCRRAAGLQQKCRRFLAQLPAGLQVVNMPGGRLAPRVPWGTCRARGRSRKSEPLVGSPAAHPGRRESLRPVFACCPTPHPFSRAPADLQPQQRGQHGQVPGHRQAHPQAAQARDQQVGWGEGGLRARCRCAFVHVCSEGSQAAERAVPAPQPGLGPNAGRGGLLRMQHGSNGASKRQPACSVARPAGAVQATPWPPIRDASHAPSCHRPVPCPCRSVVLDAEAVAFDHSTGKILPFQVGAYGRACMGGAGGLP